MGRLLIIGLVIIEYMGEHPTQFRGAVHKKKYMTVEKGDRVVTDEVTAITYCRGTQWKRVESDVDISSLIDDNPPISRELDPELLAEIADTETPSISFLRVATLANLNDLNDDEIKKACKDFGIKYGKKKMSDLTPLLIPFLEERDRAKK